MRRRPRADRALAELHQLADDARLLADLHARRCCARAGDPRSGTAGGRADPRPSRCRTCAAARRAAARPPWRNCTGWASCASAAARSPLLALVASGVAVRPAAAAGAPEAGARGEIAARSRRARRGRVATCPQRRLEPSHSAVGALARDCRRRQRAKGPPARGELARRADACARGVAAVRWRDTSNGAARACRGTRPVDRCMFPSPCRREGSARAAGTLRSRDAGMPGLSFQTRTGRDRTGMKRLDTASGTSVRAARVVLLQRAHA